MERDITSWWIQFVEQMVLKRPAVAYAQERKFVEHAQLIIPGNVWKNGVSHTLPQLGYSEDGSKRKQLTRDYVNMESIEKAKEIFKARDSKSIASVGISTIGGEKRSSSQGHCIRSIVVNYFSPSVTPDKKPRLTIDIEYRTTELLRKFGADLIFFYDTYIPMILKDNPWGIKYPDEVRLYFPTCFFSALFIPVFFQFRDPVEFLEQAEKYCDKVYYHRLIHRAKTLVEKSPEDFGFQSRRNMQELAHNTMDEQTLNRLKKFLKN